MIEKGSRTEWREKKRMRRNGDFGWKIQRAKLMGLNYESLFNCAPGAYSIVYLINKSIRRRTESNDELLNGIMNPLGRTEDIYRIWCGSMLNLHIRLVQY